MTLGVDENCGNCAYGIPTQEGFIECHRFPPVGGQKSNWGICKTDEWCAEHSDNSMNSPLRRVKVIDGLL